MAPLQAPFSLLSDGDDGRKAYNAAIYQRASVGDTRGAVASLERMSALGVAPDTVSYNAVIAAFARARDADSAEEWARRMAEAGVVPDLITFTTLVEVWTKAGRPQPAAGWLQRMLDAQLQPSERLFQKVVECFERSGDAEGAARWRLRQEQGEASRQEGAAGGAGARRTDALSQVVTAADVWVAAAKRNAIGPKMLGELAALAEAGGQGGASFGDAICRCAARGDAARAASWLEKMVEAGFSPDALCYEAVIDAFVRRGDPQQAGSWFERALDRGLLLTTAPLNRVLESFAFAGDVKGAVRLFRLQTRNPRGPKPDVGSFNAMLRCTKVADHAITWFQRIGEAGLQPDASSYAAVASRLAEQGDLEGAARWLEQMYAAGLRLEADGLKEIVEACTRHEAAQQAKLGTQRDGTSGSGASAALFAAMALRSGECEGGAAEASLWLEHLCLAIARLEDPAARTAFEAAAPFSVVINASLEDGNSTRAALWLDRQLALDASQVQPALVVRAVRALLEADRLPRAQQLLERAVERLGPGACADAVVDLVGAWASRRQAEQAAGWLEKLAKAPDSRDRAVAAYKLAVAALVKSGDVAGAAVLLQRAADLGLSLDIVPYNQVITGFANRGETLQAKAWYDRMAEHGVRPDATSAASVTRALARFGDARQAEEWLENLRAKQYGGVDAFAYTCVIDAYARQGEPRRAEFWLSKLVSDGFEADAAAYNAVINAWAKRGDVDNAVRLLQSMSGDRAKPNLISYSTVIQAFAKKGDIEQAARWHRSMLAANISSNVVVYNSLISCCAKLGDTAGAELWLQRMRAAAVAPDTISYNTVIHSGARRGAAKTAARWFKNMVAAQVAPDDISYNAMVSAYARIGERSEAKLWASRMAQAGFTPDVVTWTALIDSCANRSSSMHNTTAKEKARARKTFQEMAAAAVKPDNYTLRALGRILGEGEATELCDSVWGAGTAAAAQEKRRPARPRSAQVRESRPPRVRRPRAAFARGGPAQGQGLGGGDGSINPLV